MYTQYTSDTNHPKHFQDAEGGAKKWIINKYNSMKKQIYKKLYATYKIGIININGQPLFHPIFTIFDKKKWNMFLNEVKKHDNNNDDNNVHNRHDDKINLSDNCKIIIKINDNVNVLQFMYEEKNVAKAEIDKVYNKERFIGTIIGLLQNNQLSNLKEDKLNCNDCHDDKYVIKTV